MQEHCPSSATGECLDSDCRPGGFTLGSIFTDAWTKLPGHKATAWKAVLLFVVVEVLLGLLLWGCGGIPMYFSREAQAHASGLVGPLFLTLILLPMLAGFWFVGVAIARGERPDLFSVFGWYDETFKLLLVVILSYLLVAVGTIFFVIPGVYLLVSYQLAIPLAVDRQLGPWEAMETSRRIIGPHWFRVAGLDIVATALLLCSVLLLGIPLIWVVPGLLVVWGLFYDTLAGTREETLKRTRHRPGRRGLRPDKY